jgi:phosphopantothenoylcysteine decarboxylase/phosphopantothenate--cysteine ligase
MEERKAKMASIAQIVESVIRRTSAGELSGKKVLIIEGATREPIDDMRFLSNRATGRTGNLLACEAFRRGADVIVLAGENVMDIPDHVERITFTGTGDLMMKTESVSREHGRIDICFFVAGISDYAPGKTDGKISSGRDSLTLELRPTPKVINRFRELNPDTFLVGFKAESVKDDGELIRRAYERMNQVGMDLVVANDLSNVTDSSNTVMTITPSKEVFRAEGKKEQLALFIINKTVEMMVSKRGSS